MYKLISSVSLISLFFSGASLYAMESEEGPGPSVLSVPARLSATGYFSRLKNFLLRKEVPQPLDYTFFEKEPSPPNPSEKSSPNIYLGPFRKITFTEKVKGYKDYCKLNEKVEKKLENVYLLQKYALDSKKDYCLRLLAAQNFDYLSPQDQKQSLMANLLSLEDIDFSHEVKKLRVALIFWQNMSKPTLDEQRNVFLPLVQKVRSLRESVDRLPAALDLMHYIQDSELKAVVLTFIEEIANDKNECVTRRIGAGGQLFYYHDVIKGFDSLLKLVIDKNLNLEKDEEFNDDNRRDIITEILQSYRKLPPEKISQLLKVLKKNIKLYEDSPGSLYRLAVNLFNYGDMANPDLATFTYSLIKRGYASKEETLTRAGVICAYILVHSGKPEHIKEANKYYQKVFKSDDNYYLKLLTIQQILQSEVEELKKYALGYLPSLLENEKVVDDLRLKAAGMILVWGADPSEKKKALSTVKEITDRIIKKSKFLPYDCLKAFKLFAKSSGKNGKALALEMAQMVFKHKKSKPQERILAARLILETGNKQQKEEVYKYLKVFMDKTDFTKKAADNSSDSDEEEDSETTLHRKALLAVVKVLPEKDERHQLALQQLIQLANLDDDDANNTNNPYKCHAEMLKKRSEPVEHHPQSNALIDDSPIVLNIDYVKKLQSVQELPKVTYKTLRRLSRQLFKEIDQSNGARKEFNTLRGEISQQTLIQASDSVFFRNLFINDGGGDEKKVYIDPTVIKFYHILDKTQKLSTEGTDGLSPQARQILQLLLNVATCPTGKENGIQHTFLRLDKESVVGKGLSYVEGKMEEQRSKERFLNLLDNESRKLRSQMLNGASALARKLTQTEFGKDVAEEAHQGFYLYNFIGDEVGVKFEGEMVKFDPNGGAVALPLRLLSRQDVLNGFYETLTTEKYIKHFVQYLNERVDHKHPESNLLYNGMRELLGSDAIGEESDLLSYDDNFLPTGITTKGVAEILMKAGHLCPALKKVESTK